MSERSRCRRIEYNSACKENTTIVGGLVHSRSYYKPSCLQWNAGIFNAEIS